MRVKYLGTIVLQISEQSAKICQVSSDLRNVTEISISFPSQLPLTKLKAAVISQPNASSLDILREELPSTKLNVFSGGNGGKVNSLFQKCWTQSGIIFKKILYLHISQSQNCKGLKELSLPLQRENHCMISIGGTVFYLSIWY